MLCSKWDQLICNKQAVTWARPKTCILIGQCQTSFLFQSYAHATSRALQSRRLAALRHAASTCLSPRFAAGTGCGIFQAWEGFAGHAIQIVSLDKYTRWRMRPSLLVSLPSPR